MSDYLLRNIPDRLWHVVGVRARAENKTIRGLILELLGRKVKVHLSEKELNPRAFKKGGKK